jgi:hypothetical protein
MDIKKIVSEIDTEIAQLLKVKHALLGVTEKRGPGRPRLVATALPVAKKKAKRKMSAEARARIAAAQKARWAKAKK